MQDTFATAGPQLSGSNLVRAGDHNQRVTLHAVRVNGPITRADLAVKTGLTPATIANITNRLLRDRLITNAGRLYGARGQPAHRFVINPDVCYSIGLNIDRDHLTLVLLDFVGRVRARESTEINFAKPDTVRSFFGDSSPRLMQAAGISPQLLTGVGIAIPDDMTLASLPEQPPDYAEWASVQVAELIRDILRVPVYVENDAAAAAIGELHFGSGHRFRSFFYVLVSAALGGGLVVDGSYFRGATGRSGEIGLLRGRDRRGVVRELQNIVSLSALISRLGVHGFAIAAPRDLAHLPDAAQAVMVAWIHESTDALTESLRAINCLINPEAILIGGRLPADILDDLAASLNARMRTFSDQIPANAPIERALTADDAPAVGAAILPFSHRWLPARFALLKPT